MNIARGLLLAKLNECAAGLDNKPELEQSNCFVFKGGRVYTFNGEILVSAESPIPFDAAVNAQEFLGVISKLPDEEIDVSLRGNELRVKGARRSAGIAAGLEIALPIDVVPAPDKWKKVGEGLAGALQQAAKVAGKDETQYLATCVNVAPDKVEACDTVRMIRVDMPTGLTGRLLVPAATLERIAGIELVKVAVGDGWLHFKTGAGSSVSVRADPQEYHDGLDTLLELEGPEDVVLPANLREILERAEVFLAAGDEALVNVKIAENELTLTSRKEGGWYREKKRVRYAGRPLHFDINPKFLVDVLKHTRDVKVDDRRMAIAYDRTRFVVALTAKEDSDATEAETGQSEETG